MLAATWKGRAVAVKVMLASHGEHAGELESFRQEVRGCFARDGSCQSLVSSSWSAFRRVQHKQYLCALVPLTLSPLKARFLS